jgi:WD40 repeat protein
MSSDGRAAGTCFQVEAGVLVTAWHVLNNAGAGTPGQRVDVEPLSVELGTGRFSAVTRRASEAHDLAVLTAPGIGLDASIDGFVVPGPPDMYPKVVVTGIADIFDPGHPVREADAPGTWAGGMTRADGHVWGQLTCNGLVPGMSGAPVRRVSDNRVMGVVSGRLNSSDGWTRDRGWVARVEDLLPLLEGLAAPDVLLPDPEAPSDRIDYSRSHAILVGASEYTTGSGPGSAAANSLAAMRAMLTGPRCGWPENRVHTFLDANTRDAVLATVTGLVKDATDVLLFSYVGHGQLVRDGADLSMALTPIAPGTTHPARGSLLLSDLHAAQAGVACRARVYLLDCCFTAPATRNTLGAYDLSQRVGRIVATPGVFTLAASRHDESAVFPTRAGGVTYLTEYLTGIVAGGIGNDKPGLTLADIYDELEGRFAELNNLQVPAPPKPARKVTGTAGALVFARNTTPPAGDVQRRPRITRRQVLVAGVATAALTATGATGATLAATNHPRATPSAPGATAPGTDPGSGTGPATTRRVPPTSRVSRVTAVEPVLSHTAWVLGVAFSPDGHLLASGGHDDTIRFWNTTDLAHVTQFSGPLVGQAGFGGGLAFRPQAHVLAGTVDESVQLWETSDPAHAVAIGPPLTGHSDSVFSVAFSPDGTTLASAAADRSIRLWDTRDPANAGPLGQPLLGHTGAVWQAVFSPSGQVLASCDFDAEIRLWNVSDPANPAPLGAPLRGHSGPVMSVAFSPDGSVLASGSMDGTVRLWDVGRPAATLLGQPLTGHLHPLNSVAISRDWILASGGISMTIHLDNIADPLNPVPLGRPLAGFRDAVKVVAFTNDGATLAGGSIDSTIRLWRLS